MNAQSRFSPRPYRASKRRWPLRLVAGLLSLGGLLGLWQVVARVPAAAAQPEPTLQSAEQQLQPGGGTQGWFSSQGAPRPPDTTSGVS